MATTDIIPNSYNTNIPLSNAPPDPVISLNSSQGPQYSQGHVDDLSQKYDQVLGAASPGIPAVETALTTNSEARLQDLAIQQKGLQLAGTRNSLIQAIANRSGGSPSPADIAAVSGLSQQDLASPNLGAILEAEYAKQTVNASLDQSNNATGAYDSAIRQNPSQTNAVLDQGEFQSARNLISGNILDSLNKQYDQSSLLTKGLAWAQTLVPFRSWYAMNTALGADTPPTVKDILPGDTLSDNISYLHTLPPDEYKTVLQSAVDRLTSQGDYSDAQLLVQGTLSFGTDDKNWQNVFAGLDVASVAPIGTVAKALKGASLAVNIAKADTEGAAAVTNFLGKSAAFSMQNSIAKGTLPSLDVATMTDVEKALPSIERPAQIFTGVQTQAPAPVTGRLETSFLIQQAQARADAAQTILSGVNKVNRLTPQESQIGIAQTEQMLRDQFVDQNHHIVDFVPVAPDNETNVTSVTMRLGQTNGDWFPTQGNAQSLAGKWLKLKTNDYKITDTGSGWSIDITRPVDESALPARDLTVDTDNKAPDTFWTRTSGWLMGANTKMSTAQIEARGTVVMSEERLNGALSVFSRPLQVLSKDKAGAAELDQFMEASRDHIDPVNGRGVTYQTQPAFEDAWSQQFNKLPTIPQADAYWAYKQFYDTDWLSRNLDVYKQKSINGIENISAVRGTGSELTDSKVAASYSKMIPQESVNFEGKVLESLPRGHPDDFNVAVLDDKGVLTGKLFSKYAKDTETKTPWGAIEDKLTKGWKVIQPAEGSVEIDSRHYNFVVAKNFKRDRPSLDLNYRDGTRVIQKYPWYVKQSRLSNAEGSWFYHGDLTLANGRDAQDASFIAQKMNEAREMARVGNPGTKQFFLDNFPHLSYEDFLAKLKAQGGRLDVPFVAVRSGQRTVDTTNIEKLLQKAGHSVEGSVQTNDAFRLNNRIRGKFLGERNDTDMATWASEKGKIFELAGSNKLSPMEAMRLSMSNLVDVNLVNDYKIKSVRDFTQQYGHLLDGTQADFDANGLNFIYNPKYLPNANVNEVRTAEGMRHAILSLWSQSTTVDRQISMYKERLVRGIRGITNDQVADIANEKVLPAIQNADRYMRAFAFHSKMGNFNPKQFFLQAASAVNVLAVSPIQGSKAAMLSLPIMMGLKAPDTLLDSIGARLGSFLGVKPADYVELVRLYKQSGFDLVRNDVSYLDDLSGPKIIQGKLKPILDAGTGFFRGGERTARTMAFATAYLEAKTAGKVIDRNAEAWMLSRAKNLVGNMTRDSNAPYQQGFAAVATQFFGYQMRLAEQMLGLSGALTVPERARLFTGMSLMYGMPVAAGMTVGVIPVREWFKDWMNQAGVDTSANPLLDAWTDGLSQQLLTAMSGRKFDVSTPYGPGGISTFYDALKGSSDTTWNDLLLGASGGIIGDTVSDADPIFKYFSASVNFNDVSTYQVLASDLLKPLRDITTVNNATRFIQAVNLGQWMSKNESAMTDITPLEAGIAATLGTDPQSVSDAFSQQYAMKLQKTVVEQGSKEITENYKLALQALKADDNDLAAVYFGRVKAAAASAGMTMQQEQAAVKLAISPNAMDAETSARFAQFEQTQ